MNDPEMVDHMIRARILQELRKQGCTCDSPHIEFEVIGLLLDAENPGPFAPVCRTDVGHDNSCFLLAKFDRRN